MGIMKRDWTESDKKELNDVIAKVERLNSKKEMIKRLQMQDLEKKYPLAWSTKGNPKIKVTF